MNYKFCIGFILFIKEQAYFMKPVTVLISLNMAHSYCFKKSTNLI
jgi:hypothetical protein